MGESSPVLWPCAAAPRIQARPHTADDGPSACSDAVIMKKRGKGNDMDTQQITPVKSPIAIPALIAGEELEARRAKRVMLAWAAQYCPDAPFRFLEGRDYRARVGERTYRFQCQRNTEQNTYGFQASSLKEVDQVLLFREAPEGGGRYVFYCCPPEEICRRRKTGPVTITPDFSEDDQHTVWLAEG